MANYLFAFYGGMVPENPGDMQRVIDAWMAWFRQMGDSVVEQGSATIPGKIVSRGGVEDAEENSITGYTVVKAENIDEAVELAKGCPGIKDGTNQIAVCEFAKMP